MRYSIMLQLVVATTLIMVASGAFFAWLQNRPRLDPFEGSQVGYAFLVAAAAEASPSYQAAPAPP